MTRARDLAIFAGTIDSNNNINVPTSSITASRIIAPVITGTTVSGNLTVTNVVNFSSEMQIIGRVGATISSAGFKELFRTTSSRLVSSGIFTISATRGNYVTSAMYSWCTSHSVQGTITQLSGSLYTQHTLALDVEGGGGCVISINWTGFDSTFPMNYQVSVITFCGGSPDFSQEGADRSSAPSGYTRLFTRTQIANGFAAQNGQFTGSLSKGSGSFLIDHPLPDLSETHNLVHSFIEGPQADLIYRGKITLSGGQGEVDIDQSAGMTTGTFEALCRDVQCFTSNETGWSPVKGSVSGNKLTISCQDSNSSDTVSWLVIGERKDPHILNTDWTDDQGRVIVEPLKNPPIEHPPYPENDLGNNI